MGPDGQPQSAAEAAAALGSSGGIVKSAKEKNRWAGLCLACLPAIACTGTCRRYCMYALACPDKLPKLGVCQARLR